MNGKRESLEDFSFINWEVFGEGLKDKQKKQIMEKLVEMIVFNILKPQIGEKKIGELVELVFGAEFLL